MYRCVGIAARGLWPLAIAVWLVSAPFLRPAPAQPVEQKYCIFPEQRCFELRGPDELCPAKAPNLGAPKTVSDLESNFEEYYLTLDEAIQIALANAEVVRVLTGTTAVSTGNTIYDPAIVNTDVDQARSLFDPVLELGNIYQRFEELRFTTPTTLGTRDTEQYNFDFGVTQMKASGGTKRFGVITTPTTINNSAPQTPTSVETRYTQPLLRGRGARVNLAPIVIARINTERSFYQLKSAVQELVRSVVDGYWSLVQARVELWARQQQVEQLQYAYNRLEAQRRADLADLGDTAQAKVSLEQFRANLISTQARVLDLEGALYNVLGLPPVPDTRLVPVTPPIREPIETEWDALVATAAEQRPEIVERKLAIEVIQQQLIINCNNTLPQLDAVGLTRVNSLSVDTPSGTITNDPFQATDIQIGLNLRTPLGQRSARAALRQQELTLARERANLNQALHQATHLLAQSLRSMAQAYRQYEAFKKVRDASKTNLDRRFQVVRVGGLRNEPLVYLDVLLAVTDWGNAVSSEAQSLTRYNAEIANLETQAGVILARHGILFQEEGYRSLGPWGRLGECRCYPQATPLGPNSPYYENSDEPAEEAFDLESPIPAPGQGNSSGSASNASDPDDAGSDEKELLNELFQRAKPAEPDRLPSAAGSQPQSPVDDSTDSAVRDGPASPTNRTRATSIFRLLNHAQSQPGATPTRTLENAVLRDLRSDASKNGVGTPQLNRLPATSSTPATP
jgi:outer membrane protein TolC